MITKIWLSDSVFELVKTNARIGRKLKKIYWGQFNRYLDTREDMWNEEGECLVQFEDFISWLRKNKRMKVKVLKGLSNNQKPKKDFAF